MPDFLRSSDLETDPQKILQSLDMHRVNDELRPLLRMTVPQAWEHRPVLEWPENQQLFKSWILLLGFVPVDRHSVVLQRATSGLGFVESSSSLINARWNHVRNVIPIDGGCRVSDEIRYHCRLPVLGYVLKPIYWLVFWWRHRNLRSRYGSLAG